MNSIRTTALLLAIGMTSTSFGQLIIGHRGASYDAPENTISAFNLAIEQGADGFESDFYLTIDGHIVCFHDKDTERITGTKLLMSKAPFSALRKLDVGGWKGPQWKGEQMPTLDEVLAVVSNGKMIYIELKSGPEIVEPMVQSIQASSVAPEQIMVISFHADAIAATKKRLPDIRAHWLSGYKEKNGRLTPTKEEVAKTIRHIGADGFGSQANPEHFDAEFVQYLFDSGCREFHVWTVNDLDVARFYQALGPFSITTDRPGWLREQLEKAERR